MASGFHTLRGSTSLPNLVLEHEVASVLHFCVGHCRFVVLFDDNKLLFVDSDSFSDSKRRLVTDCIRRNSCIIHIEVFIYRLVTSLQQTPARRAISSPRDLDLFSFNRSAVTVLHLGK